MNDKSAAAIHTYCCKDFYLLYFFLTRVVISDKKANFENRDSLALNTISTAWSCSIFTMLLFRYKEC